MKERWSALVAIDSPKHKGNGKGGTCDREGVRGGDVQSTMTHDTMETRDDTAAVSSSRSLCREETRQMGPNDDGSHKLESQRSTKKKRENQKPSALEEAAATGTLEW